MSSICATCNGEIQGQCVQALGKKFHPDHFRCNNCNDKLSGKIFTYQDKPICEGCYGKLLAICKACGKPIFGQSIRALDAKWHKECFKCDKCNTLLGGSFVQKNGVPFCNVCVVATSVECAGCGKPILDKVCNALDKTWHVNCFTCTVCKQPFTSGKIFEKGGKPYCEEHLISSLGDRRSLPPRRQPSPSHQTAPKPDSSVPPRGRGGSRRVIPPRRATSGINTDQVPTRTQDDEVILRPNSPRSRGRRPLSLQSKVPHSLQSQQTPPRQLPEAPSTDPSDRRKIRGGSMRGIRPSLPTKPQITVSSGKDMTRGTSVPALGDQSEITTSAKVRASSISEIQDGPERKLAETMIEDMRTTLSWFSSMWAKESQENKNACMKLLEKDLHDALVNTKKSGPLQVKSWTRSMSSLNITVTADQLKLLFGQTGPLHQNISNLMKMAYNISIQRRVEQPQIGRAISNIHSSCESIAQVVLGCCTVDMLAKIINDTVKQLQNAPNTAEPLTDILNAAKVALKPMRIHNLVVQNVRNSLENLRSMTMQLIYAIRSLSPEENVILHRKAVDIICGVRNIISLNKIFLQEIATLFELERSGLLVKQQPKQVAADYEEDVNIWTFAASVDTSAWPEQSGTLNSLVLTLTSIESFDSSFQKCFITMYRSFTTPEKLFSKLLERYNVPATQRKSVEVKQIQLRVAIILKYWFETQIRDFDDMLIKELYEFIDVQIKRDGHADVSAMLKKSLDQVIENDNKKPVAILLRINLELTPVSPTDLFLQSSPRDMAEQLTLISSTIYRTINLTELLSQAWSKPKTRHKCPNVTALIQRFNQFSFWVPTMILSFESLRERSLAITKFIEIAKELRELQNFDGIMGVVAGLTMSPVSRLNFSKLTVSEKLLSYFDELEAAMQPSQSWKIYRNALQSCTTAAVPYLGMYLTDLTFIEDGNPDFNTTPDGTQLINFRKQGLLYKVLQEIQVYQSQSYAIEPKEPLASYLRYLPHLSDVTLYDMSLTREPRGATIKDLIS